jgi:hypothetical protein
MSRERQPGSAPTPRRAAAGARAAIFAAATFARPHAHEWRRRAGGGHGSRRAARGRRPGAAGRDRARAAAA